MHICQKMILKELDVSVFNEIVWKSLTSFDHSRSPWDRQRFDTINFASKTKLLSSQLKIAKLQAVQNFACRIVSGAQKYDHASPILRQLNWLPVKQHLCYPDSILAFNVWIALRMPRSTCLISSLSAHPYQPTKPETRSC